MQAAGNAWQSKGREPDTGSRAGRFRLLHYFLATSLVAFAAVGVALFFLERAARDFFEKSQAEQNAFFAQAQEELVRQQKETARSNLLVEHEADHVTLTHFFANAMWERHFAPLVDASERMPLDECRIQTERRRHGIVGTAASQACFAEVGRRIRALPGFEAANKAVFALTRNTDVFKIKVYDLRGLTVYSSEANQVGEDKADNLGWIKAVNGKAASELVHRDRFSTFEGEVQNRDLIQTYVPVFVPGTRRVAGVFEIYSDVTPVLQQIDAVAAQIGEVASANQERIENASAANQRRMEANSNKLFAIVGGLLALLYAALLVLVHNGQRIIDEQARAREQAAVREQHWHREKMAALAAMAANASHEIGNPLAVISDAAEDIARAPSGEPVAGKAQVIAEQASRIAVMTRQITDFAAARSESTEPVDANPMVRAVCSFLSFDNRFRSAHIETKLAEDLPACAAIPDHLNEVLMTLLQAYAEATPKEPAGRGRVLVQTETRGPDIVIRIVGEDAGRGFATGLAATDWRIEAARRRVEGMRGRMIYSGAAIEIFLPAWTPEPVRT